VKEDPYTYAVARIRALETRLLDRAGLERLLGEDPQGVIRFLKESDYADSLAQITGPHDLEEGLNREINKVLNLLEEIAPDKELIQLFRLRYDFHNLKVLLKAKYLQLPPEDALLNLGLLDPVVLRTAIEENKYGDLPDPLKIALQEAIKIYESGRGLRVLSLTLDRLMWGHFLETARKYGVPFLIELFQQYIDLANIKAFVRIKGYQERGDLLEMALIPDGKLELRSFLHLYEEPWDAFFHWLSFSPYEDLLEQGLRSWPEEKSFWRLELACDNHILKYLEGTRGIFFGIAPLICYLIYKENEVKLLRLLLVGKLNGVPVQKLRERLRAIYV